MLSLHDFKCLKDGMVFELFVEGAPPRTVECPCGGVAERVWLKAPGVVGDIAPYYDVQLGRQVNSRQERDAILKSKGLIAMAPEEFKRTENNHHAPGDNWDSTAFGEAAEKAWSDTINGNIPLVEARPLPNDVSETKIGE